MVHAAFKTVSNAIELAMIASSTALMQVCKRGAPSARAIGLNEMCGRVLERQLVSAVRRSSVAFNSLNRDQFYHRNVQQNLCRLC